MLGKMLSWRLGGECSKGSLCVELSFLYILVRSRSLSLDELKSRQNQSAWQDYSISWTWQAIISEGSDLVPHECNKSKTLIVRFHCKFLYSVHTLTIHKKRMEAFRTPSSCILAKLMKVWPKHTVVLFGWREMERRRKENKFNFNFLVWTLNRGEKEGNGVKWGE